MNHKDYIRMSEDAAHGQFLAECIAAIFRDDSAQTLADLQRSAYKYTDAGVAVAAMLHDGTPIYSGDARAKTIKPDDIMDLGVSSIVEGSDAEVPLEWLRLPERTAPDYDREDPCAETGDAPKLFDKLVEAVNAEACRLWDDCHDENGNEIGDPDCQNADRKVAADPRASAPAEPKDGAP